MPQMMTTIGAGAVGAGKALGGLFGGGAAASGAGAGALASPAATLGANFAKLDVPNLANSQGLAIAPLAPSGLAAGARGSAGLSVGPSALLGPETAKRGKSAKDIAKGLFATAAKGAASVGAQAPMESAPPSEARVRQAPAAQSPDEQIAAILAAVFGGR